MTRTYAIVSVLALSGLAAVAACSDETSESCLDCGQGAAGASTTTTTTTGTGATGGSGGQGAEGGSTSQGGGGSGGGAAVCGGIAGLTCDEGSYCDFQPSQCGGDDTMGECLPRPTNCDDNVLPVCACDGTVYSNACEAQAAGFDVNTFGCEPPTAAQFACGFLFCELASEYCERMVSDVAGIDDEFFCTALPGGCGNTPDCDCLADVTCGTFCDGSAVDGLTVTCPGG